MPRRVRVPAADDLFRPTAVPTAGPIAVPTAGPPPGRQPDPSGHPELAEVSALPVAVPPAEPCEPAEPSEPSERRTASGRVRHDEKMTVYVTADELLAIEDARLELRRSHGLAVDRGRIVRAAVAMALADLDAQGERSALVQRLDQG